MANKASRRDMLIGGALLSTAPLLPAQAQPAGLVPLAPAAALMQQTQAFLSLLDPQQRRTAIFQWDGPEWRSWNYFGVGGFIKPGLRLEQMRAEQKAAAWAMLATVLSPAGLEKARTVMLLQDILATQGNGAGQRSSERFSLSVFGEPAAQGRWGVRLEGHHLTLSVSVHDGAIVSVTPSAFAALPNRVTSGKHAGLVTLKGEEQIARRLHADLAPAVRKKAQISDRHLFNILSYAGSERANAKKVGIAAADMSAAQRDLLWELVETYAVSHLVPALADAQKKRVRSGDAGSVHFGWYGANTAEQSFGYRVIADGFVVELGCIDDKAQHLHTIYNDLGNVLGRAS